MIPRSNLPRFLAKALQQPGYAARVFVRRLKAYGSYCWGNGISAPPEAITLFLTHRCNLSCRMCGQWGESGVTRAASSSEIRSELSGDALSTLIEEFAAFRPNVTLFGGEPLLHPECVPLIRRIKERRMHCLLITNGSLLEQHAQAIVSARLDELNVSIDGSESLHDEIRGLPGLFQTVMRGLRAVRERKADTAQRYPLVNLQCTISKYNYRHLGQLLEVAQEVGCASLTFHNLIFVGRTLLDQQRPVDAGLGSSSKSWEGFVSEPGIDPNVLYDEMRSIRSKRYPFSVDFYPNFSQGELVEYYRNPCYHPNGGDCRCRSPWIVAYIFPDGEARPCLNSSYSFGNVKGKPFKEIWNSPAAVTYRRHLKEKGIFPVCVRCTELYRY